MLNEAMTLSMFTRRKKSQRAVPLSLASHPSQHLQPPEDAAISNALLAASQAFAATSGNLNPNPKLSSSAAAAALKSAALQPPNPTTVIGSIPTSRMLRRKGSYSSSVGSFSGGSSNSVPRREVQGAQVLERKRSTTSLMGERSFRSNKVRLQRGAYGLVDGGSGYGSDDIGGGVGSSFSSLTSSGRRIQREKERDRERGGSLDSGVGSYSVDNPPPVPEIPHEIFVREQSRIKQQPHPQKQPVAVTDITTATTTVHASRLSGSRRQMVGQTRPFHPPQALAKPDCECSCSCHSKPSYYDNRRYLIDEYEMHDVSPRSSGPFRRPSIQPSRRSAPLATTSPPPPPPTASTPSVNIYRLLRTDVHPRGPPPAPTPPTSAMKQHFPWLARSMTNGDDLMAGMSFGLLPTPAPSPSGVRAEMGSSNTRRGSAKTRANGVRREDHMKDSGILSPPEAESPTKIRHTQRRRGSISSNNPSKSNPSLASGVMNRVCSSPPAGREARTPQQVLGVKSGHEGDLLDQDALLEDLVFPERSRIRNAVCSVGGGGSNPALEAARSAVGKVFEEASDDQEAREEYGSGRWVRKGGEREMRIEVEGLEEVESSPVEPQSKDSSQSTESLAAGLGILDTDNVVSHKQLAPLSSIYQEPGAGKDNNTCISHGAQEDLLAGVSQIPPLASIPEEHERNGLEGVNEQARESPSDNVHNDQSVLTMNQKEQKTPQNGYTATQAGISAAGEIPELLPPPRLVIQPATPQQSSEPFIDSESRNPVSRTPSNATQRKNILRVDSTPMIPTVVHVPPSPSVSPPKSAMKKSPRNYHAEKKLPGAFDEEVNSKGRNSGGFVSWFKRDKGKKKGKKGRLSRKKDIEALAHDEKDTASPVLSDPSAGGNSLKTKPHKIEATVIKLSPLPGVKEKPRLKQAISVGNSPGEQASTSTNQPELLMSTEPGVQLSPSLSPVLSPAASPPLPSDDNDNDSLSGSSVYEDAREELPLPSPPPALSPPMPSPPQNLALANHVTSTNQSSPTPQKQRSYSSSKQPNSRNTRGSPSVALAIPSPRYELPPAAITPRTQALIEERRRQISAARKRSKGGPPSVESNDHESYSDSIARISSLESLGSSDDHEERKGNAHPNRKKGVIKGSAPITAISDVHLNGKLSRSGETTGALMAQGRFRNSFSKITNTTPKSSSTFLGFRTSSTAGGRNGTKEKVRGKNQSLPLSFRNHPKTKFSSRFGHDSSSSDEEGRDMFHHFESRLSSDSEEGGEYPVEIDEKAKKDWDEQVERLVGIIASQKGVSLAGPRDTNMEGLDDEANVVSGAGSEAGQKSDASPSTGMRAKKKQKEIEKTKGKELAVNKSITTDDTQITPDPAQSGTGRRAKQEHSPPKLDNKEAQTTGGRFRRMFGGSKVR